MTARTSRFLWMELARSKAESACWVLRVCHIREGVGLLESDACDISKWQCSTSDEEEHIMGGDYSVILDPSSPY